MEKSKTILEVKNLIKKFTLNNNSTGTNKEITAIDNLSFKLEEGETVGLLGHNGAGKTTLIHMLINAIKPTSGSIFYFSQDFFCNTSEILRDISFASTYIKFPKELTVQENLDIFAQIYGLSRSERINQIDKYLKIFDMSFYRHKKTEILSQGLMTKLILIKAFMTRPKIVFLDEPTSSLDQEAAIELRKFIKFEQEQNKITIILASHNMHEINQLCNRIIILKNGKIINDYLKDRSIELFKVLFHQQ
jgi:ABC-2 type transport system ATP-binding protein